MNIFFLFYTCSNATNEYYCYVRLVCVCCCMLRKCSGKCIIIYEFINASRTWTNQFTTPHSIAWANARMFCCDFWLLLACGRSLQLHDAIKFTDRVFCISSVVNGWLVNLKFVFFIYFMLSTVVDGIHDITFCDVGRKHFLNIFEGDSNWFFLFWFRRICFF